MNGKKEIEATSGLRVRFRQEQGAGPSSHPICRGEKP
jgi:hypothetical protein